MAVAQCVPADLSLGLSFTTGAAVTGGLLADLVDKARTAGSSVVGWHDTETQIEMQIRKHNRWKPTPKLVLKVHLCARICILICHL